MRFFAVASVALASVASASPLINFPNPFIPGPPTQDPAFSVPQSVLDASLECPGADKNNLAGKRPLLLIPGTGNTGPESWDFTYVPLGRQLGYTPCYISPPPFMLNNSATNAEYVVNAINRVYAANNNQKFPLASWSQGGLITQWALTFFPSTQNKVDRFFSFAGDFRGTINAIALDILPTGIAPSIWQQTVGSAFLTALKNAGGLNKKVPTTSTYSASDEIVQYDGPGPIAS